MIVPGIDKNNIHKYSLNKDISVAMHDTMMKLAIYMHETQRKQALHEQSGN